MVSASVSAAMPGTSPPMNSFHEASVVASKIGTPQPSWRACSIIDMVAMLAETEPVLSAPSMVARSPSGRMSTLSATPAFCIRYSAISQVLDCGWVAPTRLPARSFSDLILPLS